MVPVFLFRCPDGCAAKLQGRRTGCCFIVDGNVDDDGAGSAPKAAAPPRAVIRSGPEDGGRGVLMGVRGVLYLLDSGHYFILPFFVLAVVLSPILSFG